MTINCAEEIHIINGAAPCVEPIKMEGNNSFYYLTIQFSLRFESIEYLVRAPFFFLNLLYHRSLNRQCLGLVNKQM